MGFFDAIYNAVHGMHETANDAANDAWASAQGQGFKDYEQYQEWLNNSKISQQNFENNSALSAQSHQQTLTENAEKAAQELAKQQQQQNWQTEYDATKYQREVADKLAAGINPAMSNGISQGTSAASQPGQTAQPNINSAKTNKRTETKLNHEFLNNAKKAAIMNNAIKNIETMGGRLTNIHKMNNGIFMLNNKKHGWYKDKNFDKTGEIHWRKQAYSMTSKINKYIKTINNLIK